MILSMEFTFMGDMTQLWSYNKASIVYFYLTVQIDLLPVCKGEVRNNSKILWTFGSSDHKFHDNVDNRGDNIVTGTRQVQWSDQFLQ